MSDVTATEFSALKSQVAALTMAVEAMLKSGGPAATANQGKPVANVDNSMLNFELLSNEWADKTVSRDPKFLKGDSIVGKKYSELSVVQLDEVAREFAFKARKGRENPNPKLQTSGKNAGKPWFEKDEFEAKLVRTWIGFRQADAGDELPF